MVAIKQTEINYVAEILKEYDSITDTVELTKYHEENAFIISLNCRKTKHVINSYVIRNLTTSDILSVLSIFGATGFVYSEE